MSTDLELDISDTELAEIMPRVSPYNSLSPITPTAPTAPTTTLISDQSMLVTAVLADPVTTKKARKPRVSKKAIATDASNTSDSISSPSATTTSSATILNKSSAGKSSAGKSVVEAEQQFTLGLSKECFTPEELAINPLTHIFIENSRVTNNELIKYQAVKASILDYKCYGKGCPTKDGNWRRRIGFLILVRNNNRDSDLRMTNLSFLCPNCYCQEKGVMAFEKMKKEIVRTCTFCKTVLDTKYNSDKCGRCAWQIKNQINKSANMDRLSRAFGTEVDGLSASNMALLMNSSILDEGTQSNGGGGGSGGTYNSSGSVYSGTTISSSGSTRIMPRQTVNPAALRIENSTALKRLFMELSEQQ